LRTAQPIGHSAAGSGGVGHDRRIEVLLHCFSTPGRVRETALAAERWGFDGVLVADSQNLSAEVWVELAYAAAATERVSLGPGVTNPVTRHPSVTASAAATLQAETGGRARLTLGRGDSAVRQIGGAPASEDRLEEATIAIAAYLRGEDAVLDGRTSRLSWLDPEQPRVPVAVAGSGPRSIAIGAAHADMVDLTIGAEPERLRWGIGTARAAGDASIGAFVNVAVHADRDRARELVRGSTAIFARFSAEGAPADGLSDVSREAIARIARGYDESRHGRAEADHARGAADGFIDRFAVAGTPDDAAERLLAIAALGVERLVIVPCSLDTDQAELDASNELFAREVLPRLREPGGTPASEEPTARG
jgi:5,10-methylenetetrahydromethanopterin reductase